jgi:hypothetical protein
MQPERRQVVILLADISGYTQFMLENAEAAVHGQICINVLIEAVLKEVDVPLTLQEIEGDAVFLYAAHPGTDAGWKDVLDQVAEKLPRFFQAFIGQMAVASEATPCPCAICRNADKLRLKVIGHVGDATFHEVAGRPQVSGTDVILTHRLLKNAVDSEEYLMLTDAAFAAFGDRLPGEFRPHVERIEGFGDVSTRVQFHEHAFDAAREALYQLPERQLRSFLHLYLSKAPLLHLRATRDQLRHPIRPLHWRDRVWMVFNLMVRVPLLTARFFFEVPRTVLGRGRRRTHWNIPASIER